MLREGSHNLNLLSGCIDSPSPSSQTNLNQPGLPNPLATKADMDEKTRNEIASSIDMLLNQAVRKAKLNAYLALIWMTKMALKSIIVLFSLFLVTVSVGNTMLSSNTSGIDEGTGFLDDFWNNIVTVISAIGSAATAFALYFVWKQARMAQNEAASTLQPWISSSYVKFVKPDRVEVALKNHGRLP